MKIRAFSSLAELNQFLTGELGVAPMDESMLPPELVELLAKDEAVINVNVTEDDTATGPENTFAEVGLDGIDLSSVMASIFGGEAEQEAGPAPEPTVSQELFDSYVEFTSKQIVRLVEERDTAIAQRNEARKVAEDEIDAHTECHGHMAAAIKQIRAQGYAESIAAGLFPGVPFERLDENQQEVLMRQAHQSIENIDAIRAELATGGVTKH